MMISARKNLTPILHHSIVSSTKSRLGSNTSIVDRNLLMDVLIKNITFFVSAICAFLFFTWSVTAQTETQFNVSPEAQAAYPEIVELLTRSDDLSPEALERNQSTLDKLMDMEEWEISMWKEIADEVRGIAVSHGEPCEEEYLGRMERGLTVTGRCHHFSSTAIYFRGAVQSDLDILQNFSNVRIINLSEGAGNIIDLEKLVDVRILPYLSDLREIKIERMHIKNTHLLEGFQSLSGIYFSNNTFDGQEMLSVLEGLEGLVYVKMPITRHRWRPWSHRDEVSFRDHFQGIERCIFYYGECLDRDADYVRLHVAPKDMGFLRGFYYLQELDLTDVDLENLDLNMLEPVFEHNTLEWIIHPMFIQLPKSEFVFFAEDFFRP